MRVSLQGLAAELAIAFKAGRMIAMPSLVVAPSNRAEAYAVQDRMAELIGDRVAGWKVGATVRAVQILEGHDGPVPGRIFASRVFYSPADVATGLVTSPKVECEFGFRLKRRLADPGGAFAAEAIADSITFHPAIELAGSRYVAEPTGRRSGTFDGIADNGSGGAVVLGAPVDAWRAIAFETLAIDARIDGGPAIEVYTGTYRRDPVQVMAETLSDLRVRGILLDEGDIVITGSLTVPTPIHAGQRLVVRFGDLADLRLNLG